MYRQDYCMREVKTAKGARTAKTTLWIAETAADRHEIISDATERI
jgi:hypothetical protein